MCNTSSEYLSFVIKKLSAVIDKQIMGLTQDQYCHQSLAQTCVYLQYGFLKHGLNELFSTPGDI